ncbi:MAG: ribonuclease HI [Bdellovibrionales bacterium]|nr:ribonuclease HI [Bdellovibrionales bacterium]
MKVDFSSIIIFTDGACSGNPGPGGWGAIIATPEGQVRELGGKDPSTTNNRMEIISALRALQALPKSETPIVLYTDSTYLIRGITQWIWGWRSRGWKNAEGKEVMNRDLWEELSKAVARLKPVVIDWKYVRGHTGVPGNERCDEIAVGFSTGRWVDLYEGPLLQYPVAIHDLPPDQELPEMKTYDKKSATPAFSYLSYHGGTVVRHRTWAECERRVKGQSAAKFKKAKSQSDEAEILKSWGLNPSTTVIKE